MSIPKKTFALLVTMVHITSTNKWPLQATKIPKFSQFLVFKWQNLLPKQKTLVGCG